MPATRSAAEASAPGIVRPICRRMKRELTARGTQLIKPRHRARLRRSRRRMKARAASGAPTAENRSSSRTLDFIPLVREGTKSRQAKRAQPRHPLRRAEPTNRAAKKGRQPDLPRPRTGSSNPLPSSRQSVSLRVSRPFEGKARVFSHYATIPGGSCQQRRAKPSSVGPSSAGVSVKPYFSTAVLPEALCEVGGTGRKLRSG